MEKIIVTVSCHNAVMCSAARQPRTREFKSSPRGLVAACNWMLDMECQLTASYGNASIARGKISLTNGLVLDRSEARSILTTDTDTDLNGHKTTTTITGNAAAWL